MAAKKISQSWNSSTSFILTTTGAVVGLGNIWKFPYEAGQHGGGSFVLLYILFLFVLGVPMLIGEMLLGKHTKKNPVDALVDIATARGHSRRWSLLGWLGAITLLVIFSFYSIVASWALYHLFQLIAHGQDALIHSANAQQQLLNDPFTLMAVTALIMLMSAFIVGRGLHKGLERACTILMPLLLILLLMFCLDNINTPGFSQTVQFMFHFDPSTLTSGIYLAALGHALFTLALGAGCMLTYGCYITDKIHLPYAATTISLLNVICALLSGFALFPIIFNAGMHVSGGATLMFDILPKAILTYSHAPWLGGIFYLLLLSAAITSTVSLIEPWVVMSQARFKASRFSISLAVSSVSFILAIPAIFSFTTGSTLQFQGGPFFNILSSTATEYLLPIGAFGFTICAGWLLPEKAWTSISDNTYLIKVIRWICRTIAPLAILVSLFGKAL